MNYNQSKTIAENFDSNFFGKNGKASRLLVVSIFQIICFLVQSNVYIQMFMST